MVSAIKANEEPVEGEYACSNDTIVEVRGLRHGRVAALSGGSGKRAGSRACSRRANSRALPLRHQTGDARATAALGCRGPLQVTAVAPSSGEVGPRGILQVDCLAAVWLIVTAMERRQAQAYPLGSAGRETRDSSGPSGASGLDHLLIITEHHLERLRNHARPRLPPSPPGGSQLECPEHGRLPLHPLKPGSRRPRHGLARPVVRRPRASTPDPRQSERALWMASTLDDGCRSRN